MPFSQISHPLSLPLSPKVRYTHLCLFCCLAYRVVIAIFLNSIYNGCHTLSPSLSDLLISCSMTISAAAAKSFQSCLTLCDPIDGSPPASPVPGILQARILEWVAIAFSEKHNEVSPNTYYKANLKRQEITGVSQDV